MIPELIWLTVCGITLLLLRWSVFFTLVQRNPIFYGLVLWLRYLCISSLNGNGKSLK